MATLVQTRIDNKFKIGIKRVPKPVIAEPNSETLEACKRADSKIGLKKVTFEKFKEMLNG